MGKDEALTYNSTQEKGQSVQQSPIKGIHQYQTHHTVTINTLCSVLSAGMVVARGMPYVVLKRPAETCNN